MTDISPAGFEIKRASDLPGTAEATQAASDAASGVISSDFETFLRMLTTQLENQDPLDPLKSTDFAVQLATFSGVEQQVLTNDRLVDLTNQLSFSNMSSLSTWIGNEVLSTSSVHFDGTAVDLVPELEDDTERAEIRVLDSTGLEVDKVSVPEDGGPVQWSGIVNGRVLSSGSYSFETVQYDSAGKELDRATTPAYQPVIEVFANGGTPQLGVPGGATVPASEVLSVRQPQNATSEVEIELPTAL